MDILIALLIILGLLMGVVAYQSRKDKPAPRVLLYRFSRLLVILISLFKDIGLCIATKVKAIEWDIVSEQTDSHKQNGGRSVASWK